MTTIRLSERLELQADAESSLIRTLHLDGEHAGIIYASAEAALIAHANPPRYDLPPGVVHGSDGKFYAPGDVVRTLPDEMWTAHYANGGCTGTFNAGVSHYLWFEARPTAANPLQPLPPFTFPLPDGTLACFRRDAAKLREAGAVLRFTDGASCTNRSYDADAPDMVLRVEFPPTPKTERVPLHDLIGRCIELGQPVTSFTASEGTTNIRVQAFWPGGNATTVHADADGTVEVLLTDTER